MYILRNGMAPDSREAPAFHSVEHHPNDRLEVPLLIHIGKIVRMKCPIIRLAFSPCCKSHVGVMTAQIVVSHVTHITLIIQNATFIFNYHSPFHLRRDLVTSHRSEMN
ncbi:unnamed protein product [Hymenolepis diminuta]|uniref:Uncharacterized protein n=1 Tax=Hymenolepis diminuta TaxID=6216 RepID=A0A564ZB66_HYMDI|nr:unnamed protein product [Hymenolepis diminuta]